MAAAVVPVGKIVYLCDDVLRDPASGKTHVLGIFNAARKGERLRQLCVFAQLIGGVGQLPVRVEVVNGETLEVAYSREVVLNFPGKLTEVAFCLRILGASFSEPGVYLVELSCGSSFIDDRLLRVLA